MNILEKLLGRAAPRKPADAAPDPARDAHDIADTIGRALSSAGLDRHDGRGAQIHATIEQALAKAGLIRADVAVPNVAPDAGAPAVLRAKVIPTHAPTDAPAPTARVAAGEFVQRSFANAAGSRDYKLYVPAAYGGDAHPPMPLVVMLHGCTQSADDFAAGTRMNALAEAHGFLVAYPSQAASANGSKCWNWFRTEDQQRGRGEPSLITGIARQVASDYRIDPRRIFVAGLSAGAAMAVILGETDPDLFAAVGAHSGLPFGAAHDVPSAFAAMQARGAGKGRPVTRAPRPPVPTIVFHGDRDSTVAPGNGRAIATAATVGGLHATEQRGIAPGGQAYTRDVFVDAAGLPRVEHWTLHGAGHAWSGGSAQGTYTDPAGPDASAEMIRFFLQQRHRAD